MVCNGMTSRLEVARIALKILDLTEIVSINPVDSSFFSQSYFAKRPSNERLLNKKLDEEGMNIMQDWKISLKQYLQDRYLPLDIKS